VVIVMIRHELLSEGIDLLSILKRDVDQRVKCEN